MTKSVSRSGRMSRIASPHGSVCVQCQTTVACVETFNVCHLFLMTFPDPFRRLPTVGINGFGSSALVHIKAYRCQESMYLKRRALTASTINWIDMIFLFRLYLLYTIWRHTPLSVPRTTFACADVWWFIFLNRICLRKDAGTRWLLGFAHGIHIQALSGHGRHVSVSDDFRYKYC